MQIVLSIVGILIGLIVVLIVVGLLLPQGHVATRSARFRQPPEVVWKLISDYAAYAEWQSRLARVERLPDQDGKPVWRLVEKSGQSMPIQQIDTQPPTRLVGRIADPKLPFGGTWTHEIEPTVDGCRLTITERGEIYNPIFRVIARFAIGYTGTIDGYLRAAGAKFGETPTLE